MRTEHANNVLGSVGMMSVGGWHTRHFKIGADWLGEAMLCRLRAAGHTADAGAGRCWGNILPPGSEYRAHSHRRTKQVAVWCLVGSGALHIAPDVVVPDRPGQLVIFAGDSVHWVPTVRSERFTIAANLI